MDEETLHRACEPFFTTKEPGHGTGLGLSAAYGIARNHLGALRLRSAVGQSTTAEMLLPVTTDGADPAGNATPAARTSPLRVLSFDDEALVRSAAADMLKALGHTATECADGVEAVRVFAAGAESYDPVILDMVMPIMPGMDTLARLRAVNPRVRAILCSGYSLDADAQQLLGHGRPSLMHKPFTIADLAAAIERVAKSED